MGDWVHCNKCSATYNSQTSFFLAECGHIFDKKCVEVMRPSKNCLICNKVTNVVPLNKDVDQKILDYFAPMESLFKKSVEVYKFQLQHRNTLQQNLLNKYKQLKREYLKCSNTNRHLIKENQMLRSMLRSGGQNNSRFTTSTPVCPPSELSINFQNTSMVSSIPVGMNSGRPRRTPFFGSGSSQRSSAQRVPLGSQLQGLPMVHRVPNVMRSSLGELRGKFQ